MKWSPPPESEPLSDSPGWIAWLRSRLRVRRAFHLALRILLVPVILLLAILVYLSLVDLPRPLVEKVLEPLRQAGLVVNLERIHLHPLDGVTAEKVKFFSQEGEWVPILEADRVIFKFDPMEWFRGQVGLKGVQVVEGLLRLGAGGAPRSLQDAQNITIQKVSGFMVFEPGGIRISSLDAEFLGIRIEGGGFIVLPPRAGQAARLPRGSTPQTAIRALERSPVWFPRLVEELNAIQFDTSPRARIEFTLYPEEPERSEAMLNLGGGRSRGRGIVFDEWNAEVQWQERRLTVPGLKARLGDRKFELSLAFEQTTRLLEIHVFSSLPPTSWTSLIPVSWRDDLENAQVTFSGPVDCELHLGPALAEEVAAHVKGWLSLEQAEVRNVWVERGRTRFEREGDVVHCREVDAVLGRDEQKGPVRGELTVNLKSGEYSGQGEASFDPVILLPNLNLKQQNIVRAMSFPEKPPSIRLEFSGVLGTPQAFRWTGFLEATNFQYNGAYISRFTAPAGVSNQILVMDPCRLDREEGSAVGRVELDFSNKTATVCGTNTANPKAMARLLGPKPEYFMRLYQVEGPVNVAVQGLIDWGATNATDLRASVNAEKLGIRWFMADRCSFDLAARGNALVITNLVGQLYGGDFGAWLNFSGLGTETNVQYSVQAACTNVDLAEVVTHLRQVKKDPYTGKLSGSVSLQGFVGDGRGNTATGSGQLSIQGGQLLQIPLLGGLSTFLSKIYPGLGFARQTDLNATYVVRNLRVKTDDLKLNGGIISLDASGKYFFNEDLDFSVKVRTPGENMVAGIFKFLTSPLSKLLEFHLYGTIREPRWRPQNLPKELFFIKD